MAQKRESRQEYVGKVYKDCCCCMLLLIDWMLRGYTTTSKA